MSSNIIPFGKYKGQPIEAIQYDKQYLDWLVNQSWFKERYQTLNAIIINNFNEPTDSPEHNKLQALFLNNSLIIKLTQYIIKNKLTAKFNFSTKYKVEEVPPPADTIKCFDAKFEQNGIDVVFGYDHHTFEPEYRTYTVFVELKPTLGDDYPAVLRQVANNEANFIIIENYNGVGATYNQVKEIFKRSGKYLIKLSEII